MILTRPVAVSIRIVHVLLLRATPVHVAGHSMGSLKALVAECSEATLTLQLSVLRLDVDARREC